MTLAELLQTRFRADLRHRGAAYIEAERISLIRVTPENVFGVVQDGAEYQTQLRYQPDDIGLFCTCEQYAKSKVCKHLWATVLAADQKGFVSPGLRPGKITPFVAPSAYQPVSVDDLDPTGVDPEGDSRTPRSRVKVRTAPVQRTLRPWESRLAALSEDMDTAGDGRGK